MCCLCFGRCLIRQEWHRWIRLLYGFRRVVMVGSLVWIIGDVHCWLPSLPAPAPYSEVDPELCMVVVGTVCDLVPLVSLISLDAAVRAVLLCMDVGKKTLCGCYDV